MKRHNRVDHIHFNIEVSYNEKWDRAYLIADVIFFWSLNDNRWKKLITAFSNVPSLRFKVIERL